MTPQLENGYTRIANEILEELAKIQISGYQWRCIMFLWRKTYGFKKCEDTISLSQWVDGTGLKKQHVCRTVKELEQRKIITKNGNKYKFNKHYQEYIELPKMVTLPKMVIPVTKNGNLSLPKMGHTKDTITKDNTTKEIGANKSPRFSPPSLEEIKKYCLERKNSVDPQRWHDFYSSKGWMIGKNKMKDWKAAIRTWERNDANHSEKKFGGFTIV